MAINSLAAVQLNADPLEKSFIAHPPAIKRPAINVTLMAFLPMKNERAKKKIAAIVIMDELVMAMMEQIT